MGHGAFATSIKPQQQNMAEYFAPAFREFHERC